MAYKKDYENSRKKEAEFEQYIKTKYNLLTENSSTKGYFPNWDVSTTSTTNSIKTYEVKYNADYGTKSKVIIENCLVIDEIKHPSGLSISESDYYVLTFENDDSFYIIPTDKLKELVASNKGMKEIQYDQAGYQLTVFQKDWLLSFATKA